MQLHCIRSGGAIVRKTPDSIFGVRTSAVGERSEKPLTQFLVCEQSCQRNAYAWGNREQKQKHPKKIEPPTPLWR